jgi:polyisoprenoid-binding protein YceI
MPWTLDPQHTQIGFSVKHMMISTVRGSFTEFEAALELDPANIEQATATASIKTASIDTKESARDNHLRSADFFDSENHPHMTFRSTAVRRSGDGLEVDGELTIRGTTQPIALKGTVEGPFKDPWGNLRVGFSLDGQIDREAYGLTWNQALEAGGFLVSKTVKLHVEAQAIAS